MILNLLLALLICGCCTFQPLGPSVPVGNQPIRVMTLNLCADWTAPRNDRLKAVATFCQDNQVDVLLVQEAVSGIGQGNAANFLAGKLGYYYSQVPAFGFPLFYQFNIGVISRWPISQSRSLGCQVPGGVFVDNVPNPCSSRALLVQTGGLWFATCHLIIPFTEENHERQVSCILGKLPAEVIWGGDFNSDRNNPAYSIITGAGFKDAPPAGAPLVDLIFYRGANWRLISSTLVLTDHYVTDHPGGVLVEIAPQ